MPAHLLNCDLYLFDIALYLLRYRLDFAHFLAWQKFDIQTGLQDEETVEVSVSVLLFSAIMDFVS